MCLYCSSLGQTYRTNTYNVLKTQLHISLRRYTWKCMILDSVRHIMDHQHFTLFKTSDSKRLNRQRLKDKWFELCAYLCLQEETLMSLDHFITLSRVCTGTRSSFSSHLSFSLLFLQAILSIPVSLRYLSPHALSDPTFLQPFLSPCSSPHLSPSPPPPPPYPNLSSPAKTSSQSFSPPIFSRVLPFSSMAIPPPSPLSLHLLPLLGGGLQLNINQ